MDVALLSCVLCLLVLVATLPPTVSGESKINELKASNEPRGTDHTGDIVSFTDVGSGVGIVPPRPYICYLKYPYPDNDNVEWLDPDGNTIPNGPNVALADSIVTRVVEGGFVLSRGTNYFSPDGDYCCVITMDGTESERRCVTFTPCPTLPSLSNGEISYNPTDNVATYTCNTGYTLTGSISSLTCNDATRQWSSSQRPTCVFTCGTPPDIDNGMVESSTGTMYMDSTIYSCNSGYLMSGSPTVTCEASGSWSTRPYCTIIDCGRPPVPSNADVSLSDGTMFNSVATHTCHPCYLRMGVSVQICGGSGHWVPAPPTCDIRDCGEPPSLVNGRVSAPYTTTCGSEVTYRCNNGYLLEGVSSRTCGPDEQWSAGMTFCEPIDCGTLDSPINGSVVLTGSYFMSRATYTCNTGYHLRGPIERTCDSDGEWSQDSPSCHIANCGTLDNPGNGSVNTSSGTTYKKVAIYNCNSGYNLVGLSSRICKASGRWSFIQPTCYVVDCGALPAPVNGAVDLRGGTTYNQYTRYSCNEGYSLTGVSTRRCTATGEWTDSAPTCDPVNCGGLEAPVNGNVDTSQGTVFMNTAVYSCDPGYNVTGCSVSECLATGSWSCDPPFCADNAIVQFKFGPTQHCVEWTSDKVDLIYKTMRNLITKAVQKKGYDIPVENIQQGYFSCYQSTTKTTYRTTITGTERLSAVDYTDMIQEWVESGVTTRVLWYAIKMDKTCPVAVASMDQDECAD